MELYTAKKLFKRANRSAFFGGLHFIAFRPQRFKNGAHENICKGEKKGGDNMVTNGFSFCGTHIKTFGLEYAPEIENTYVYRPAFTNSHIETFEGHNGGYYYGAWKEPKEFILRCLFEEKDIDKGIMSRIYAFFRVGKSGKLIFDKQPWCYYYATVTDPIEEDFSNYRNGLITIHMKAMYPFARSDIMSSYMKPLETNSQYSEKEYNHLMTNTAVFDRPGMELATEYSLVQKRNIHLVNPGTERAALGFEISGDVGSGIIIENQTTGQQCKMIAITKDMTTNVNKKIVVDPISGKTMLIGAGTKELKFICHQYGFLELAPNFPAIRNLYINWSGTRDIGVTNILEEDLTGKYIFINGEWYQITEQVNNHLLRVDRATPATQEAIQEKTMAISMNEIVINPITTMDITIRFIYKPTYS